MSEEKSVPEICAQYGTYAGPIYGCSMKPMLYPNRDIVLLVSKKSRLRLYDVAAFQSNGRCVLHRVVGLLPDAYITQGDHCNQSERVSEEQVFAVLKGFWRRNNYVSVSHPLYVLYVHCWMFIHPLWVGYKNCKHRIREFLRRLYGTSRQ